MVALDDKDVIIRTYKIRTTGRDGASIETTIPREVFAREARRLDLTVEEATKQLKAVWRFGSFKGLLLTFEFI